MRDVFKKLIRGKITANLELLKSNNGQNLIEANEIKRRKGSTEIFLIRMNIFRH